MAVPYAALIGIAAKASNNIGDQISRAYRGGHPELDREKDRIQQQYLDAIARKYGYNVNYAGTMDANPVSAPKNPLIGNQPGLGPALQALLGGDDKDKAPTADDVQKTDWFKHSGNYGDIAAQEQGLVSGGGAGGGSGGVGLTDSDITESDWFKNAGNSPESLLSRRWHPDDEKDPWGRL